MCCMITLLLLPFEGILSCLHILAPPHLLGSVFFFACISPIITVTGLLASFITEFKLRLAPSGETSSIFCRHFVSSSVMSSPSDTLLIPAFPLNLLWCFLHNHAVFLLCTIGCFCILIIFVSPLYPAHPG